MLKHILETKHAEEGFKCAVIVNDMAALNIDKSLIDQSALVQSDEVIAMQMDAFAALFSQILWIRSFHSVKRRSSTTFS